MSRYDFRTPRIHVEAALSAGADVALGRDQANHLINVLRRKPGEPVLLFNGRDGEWMGALAGSAKRPSARIERQTRPQPASGDLHFLFAPLKHARLDYLVQKAVELGASRLQPAITRHTQVARVNLERMRANVVEAAQQCGVLALPEVAEPLPLAGLLDAADSGRWLIFCDEDAEVQDPVAALAAVRASGDSLPLAVLVGPEGGFAEEERALLLKRPQTLRLALGPRILRADTAGVAALALVQAVLGDWRPDAEGKA